MQQNYQTPTLKILLGTEDVIRTSLVILSDGDFGENNPYFLGATGEGD